jgi:hypothetical protein
LAVAHAATSTLGHRRRRRPARLAKVLPEPLHAAVRVTNFAPRRGMRISTRAQQYAYAYTHTTQREQRCCCGSTCRFPPDSTLCITVQHEHHHSLVPLSRYTSSPAGLSLWKVSRLFMGGAENLERDPIVARSLLVPTACTPPCLPACLSHAHARQRFSARAPSPSSPTASKGALVFTHSRWRRCRVPVCHAPARHPYPLLHNLPFLVLQGVGSSSVSQAKTCHRS